MDEIRASEAVKRLLDSHKELQELAVKYKNEIPKELFDAAIKSCASLGMMLAESLFDKP